jgi:hypothetical protein
VECIRRRGGNEEGKGGKEGKEKVKELDKEGKEKVKELDRGV